MAHNNSTSPAAIAYAQALIELAAETGETESIGEALASLQQIVAADPLLNAFFSNPSIKTDERWDVLKRSMQGKVSAVFLNFLGVLSEKRRFELLGHIDAAYQRMLDERQNRIRVQVTVAGELAAEELAQVQQRISQAMGKSAIVEQKVDDSIIGGIVLRVEDKIIDGSVRSQLEAIRRQLISAAA